MKQITILINKDISADTLFYIADCWVNFVVGDLGLSPKDLLMILPG